MAGVSWFLIHGYALWAVWTFFGLFQITTNRYLKHHWSTNMWMHRVSGTVLLVTTLLYGLTAIIKLKFIKDDVHAPMGVAVTALILFIVISGVIARVKLVKAEQGQQKMLCYKLAHKVLAYSMLVVTQITIFFGIYSYSTNHGFSTILNYLSLAMFVGIFAGLEVWH